MSFASISLPLESGRVITFRPVTAADDAFLLAVYGSTRQEELAMTGWDAAQREAFLRMQFNSQQAHYREHSPAAEHLIILWDDVPVGRLYIEDRAAEIRILDITILPDHRGQGVGTPIIRRLMAEAAGEKPLTIYVESFNRTLALFERLGFIRSGESGYSYLMAFRPQQNLPAPSDG